MHTINQKFNISNIIVLRWLEERPALAPFLLGVWVVILCMPSYFQQDDFGILWWLRYEKTSPLDWFEVWPMGLWRPFHLATLWGEARLFGSWPQGYRLLHGALYLITIYLFLRLSLVLLKDKLASVLAACLFAATFAHWEAVQWISASSELLVGFFGVVLWLSGLHFQDTQKWSWAVLAWTVHILALLTKENAAVLLPILYVILLWQGKFWPIRRLAFHLGLWIPWVVSILGHALIAARGDAVGSGIYDAVGIHWFSNLGAYLLRLLGIYPAHAPYSGTLLCLGVFMLLVLLWALWILLKKGREFLWPWCWVLISLVPYLGLNIPQVYPSRYAYIASIGFALFTALVLNRWAGALTRRRTLAVIGVGVWCIWNLMLYAMHPEMRYWLRNDAMHREIVQDLRQFDLAGKMVSVTGWEFPDEPDPAAKFMQLSAMAGPPPNRILTEGSSEEVDLVLRWNGHDFMEETP